MPKYRPQFIVSTMNTGIQKHHSSTPVKGFRPLSVSDVCRYTSHRHLKAAQGPQNTLQTSQTGRQLPPLGPRYHSGGDKTHAVRGYNAISGRRAGKSLKADFHGQQWDNRRVHCIHGDVEGIGGLLKQHHVPLAITEVTAHRRGLQHTRTDVQAQHDR